MYGREAFIVVSAPMSHGDRVLSVKRLNRSMGGIDKGLSNRLPNE